MCPFCFLPYSQGQEVLVIGTGKWLRGKVVGLTASAAHVECYNRIALGME